MPGDEGTDWHQASTFSDETNRELLEWPVGECPNGLGGALTFWTAFTDISTTAKAPMQFLAGTHTRRYFDETKTPERDPDSIGKLRNLKTLKLKGNPLAEGEVERLKSLLPGCKIKS